MESNRISSLQSHGKALEKECCLPGVFCDSGDTPANLLCELNGHLMPCTSCFYGKWVEDVCAGQFGVFVYLYLLLLSSHRFQRHLTFRTLQGHYTQFSSLRPVIKSVKCCMKKE